MYCGSGIVSFGVKVVQDPGSVSVKRCPSFGTMPLSLYMIDNPGNGIHFIISLIHYKPFLVAKHIYVPTESAGNVMQMNFNVEVISSVLQERNLVEGRLKI